MITNWEKYYKDKWTKREQSFKKLTPSEKLKVMNEYCKEYLELLDTLDDINNARFINNRKII